MLNEKLDQDEYGTVLNSERTYKGITDILEEKGSIVIAWTDEEGTKLDILFVINPIQAGHLQRGMHWNDLFVAVAGHGMFAFDINKEGSHPSYIGDKLNLGGVNATTEKLADLINGIRKRL